MKFGANLKRFRETTGLTQQEMADLTNSNRTGYSKMENNQQEIPLACLVQIANKFGTTLDDIIYFGTKSEQPEEAIIGDKTAIEQLNLINELQVEEKEILLKLIETFISKKRFKDYLLQNIATL